MQSTTATANAAPAAIGDPARTTVRNLLRQTRVDLAAVHRITVLEGLHEGTWNHFSATVPGRPGYLLLSPGRIA